jgi:hypothetical protein
MISNAKSAVVLPRLRRSEESLVNLCPENQPSLCQRGARDNANVDDEMPTNDSERSSILRTLQSE